MAAHALLGASSAHRWLVCTPSARLEESLGIPDTGSPYAAEGTAAHKYAELELRYRLGEITKRSYAGRLKAHKATEWWGPEMEECIGDYATQIVETVEELRREGKSPTVELEQQVDYSEYVPDGFGTADVVVLSEGELHVIDLKYGKGVPVSAEDNSQLRLYALGAALKYQIIYGFDFVRMTIVQPRLGSTSTDCLSYADLIDWAETYVEPRARAADEGRGEYCPGEKQCRWCKAKAICRARADANLTAACEDFALGALPEADEVQMSLALPELITLDEVAELLPVLPRIEAWAKDVQEWALSQARDHNIRFTGYKLVEGRSNRKISDADAAASALKTLGCDPVTYYEPPKLKTLTALEKTLTKPVVADVLGDLIIKPAGKPALVPEGDKRPEINSIESAKADFADIKEGE
ncbi:MAG: DUF2800 domain-containing protein [Gordonibacter sp.]|uniref:DUF2800 domain-containing protein n=1 Tax=Gordonibacter sp. TaxID=1968902 RepID=UPI002FC6B068